MKFDYDSKTVGNFDRFGVAKDHGWLKVLNNETTILDRNWKEFDCTNHLLKFC